MQADVYNTKKCFQGALITIETQNDRSFVGDPIGLLTLTGTEIWERMNYYGMRAPIVLFMVLAIEDNGLGLTLATASAIYGLSVIPHPYF